MRLFATLYNIVVYEVFIWILMMFVTIIIPYYNDK